MGWRVHPDPHPDVVGARLAGDRHRGTALSVGQRGARREFLRGEGQVGAGSMPVAAASGPSAERPRTRPPQCRCTVSWAYLARLPDGSGEAGAGSSAMLCSAATRCRPGRAGQLDRGEATGWPRPASAQVGRRPDLARVDSQRYGAPEVHQSVPRRRRPRPAAPDSVARAGVPASAQFAVGTARRLHRPRPRPPPPRRCAPRAPSGRAWATVPVAATTASGAASQRAGRRHGRAAPRPPRREVGASRPPALLPPRLDPGSLDLSIRFPSINATVASSGHLRACSTTGNRCLMGFNKDHFPERSGRVPRLRSRPWCRTQ
jgi:hypothetical protein